MTVCDVYDALVSPRVYRDAWTHDDALALLHKDTGTAFDARCVAALERVLAREAGNVVELPTTRVPSVRPSAAAAS
jgi:HD-GYP domain-containing protein (c-di-GMP phosphodiesterase class II)